MVQKKYLFTEALLKKELTATAIEAAVTVIACGSKSVPPYILIIMLYTNWIICRFGFETITK